MTIGYSDTDEDIESECSMITSDFNFVNVYFYIEYRVSDPLQAIVYANSYESIIKNLAQSYIRDTIGVTTVDDVMTTGKAQIQTDIETKLKQRIQNENIGYTIERVLIQDAELPNSEVQFAFNNVENEKQGMETKINEAKKDRSTRIPAVEAEVDQITKSAEAYKEERINEATGQVARFEEMYVEYQKYPLITKRRMFYETMDEILPDLKVIINGSDGTQTVYPLDTFSNTIVNQSED
jgi:membrane protease subunit HflK